MNLADRGLLIDFPMNSLTGSRKEPIVQNRYTSPTTEMKGLDHCRPK